MTFPRTHLVSHYRFMKLLLLAVLLLLGASWATPRPLSARADGVQFIDVVDNNCTAVCTAAGLTPVRSKKKLGELCRVTVTGTDLFGQPSLVSRNGEHEA